MKNPRRALDCRRATPRHRTLLPEYRNLLTKGGANDALEDLNAVRGGSVKRMLFCDTSTLAKYYVPEEDSVAVQARLDNENHVAL